MTGYIKLTNGEVMDIELFEDTSITSENFKKLANKGYYEGAIFHRVIKDFMIQTGGYTVDESQYSLLELPEADSIKGEFTNNGWQQNTLKHELGVISMARTSDPNSASGQFFLCSATCPWLDGEYAAFGKTTDEESNKVILRISEVETYNIGYGFQNFPIDIIMIKEVNLSKEKF